MHLRPFLVSTVLFLLPVVHAAGIGEVNGANMALEEEADKYDSNVQNLGVLNNALINGNVRPIFLVTSVPSRSCIQGIANDLATLTTAVGTSMENGQGTAATNDPGTEESVVDSFAAVIHFLLLHH